MRAALCFMVAVLSSLAVLVGFWLSGFNLDDGPTAVACFVAAIVVGVIFGVGTDTKHLEKEAVEAQAVVDTPSLLVTELADCLMLLLDAARRGGVKPMQLVTAAQAKLRENKERSWPAVRWVYGEPQWVATGEDCNGKPLAGYWRVFAEHPAAKRDAVCGTGCCMEEALEACRAAVRIASNDELIEHNR